MATPELSTTGRAEWVAGVVVAGGRSSRMGTDKADLPWRDTTLLGHVLAALAAAVDGPLVVVGPADRPRPLPAALAPAVRGRVLAAHDPAPGGGPLQGIATGLVAAHDAGAATAFVCSVDLPRMHPAFVRAVLARLDGEHFDVALPVLGGHHEPLAAAYRTALGARAGALIVEGAARPADLFARSRVRHLAAADLLADPALAAADPRLDAVRGVNTPEEYRAARDDGGV